MSSDTGASVPSGPSEETARGTEHCVVLTTCASDDDARALASALLDQQLAACVQVLPIHSYYVWAGAQQSEPERLLLIKTRRSLYPDIEVALRTIHTYETPEIVCLPMIAGSAGYLGWIDQMTRPR